MKKRVLSIVLGISLLLLAVVSFLLIQQMSMQSTNTRSNQESKELVLPPLLEGTPSSDGGISYTITAQEGDTQLKEGKPTQTYSYNGSFLGPVIRIRKDQRVTIRTENELNTITSSTIPQLIALTEHLERASS